MTENQSSTENSKGHPSPPFPEQEQNPPGSEAAMDPKPDYGESSYEGTGRLEGRRAVVTGADSGIGRAVALAYAREGADVLISYLNEEADAKETARVVEAAGRRAVLLAGDISEEEHCKEVIARAIGELGGLDILVNNAAHQMSHESFTDIPSEELEYVFKTNIISMFHLCKAAVPHMQPGSSIINTASVQAYQPSPQLLHYAATKAAIVNFTKGLAQELIAQGIRVNGVAPGPVWTPLIPMSMPGDTVSTFGQDSPSQRPGQPVELAPIYVFLASPAASFLVGEVVGVTGGMPIQ